MSDLRHPERLLERKSLAPDLRRDLMAYGSAAPSGERRARMLAQLERELGALDGGSAGGLFSSLAMKVSLMAGALVGSLALLALLWPTPPTRDQSGAYVRSPAVVALPSTDKLREPAGRLVPIASAAMPQPSKVRMRAPERPLRGRTAKRRDQTASVSKQSPSAAMAAPQANDALAELTLLARARRALLTRPERALELAEQHARSYPSGTFREEREVLAIESLAKLRRRAEAKQRVHVFGRQFPSSTHRAHLAQLVLDE